ncbi:MAG TPA: mannosyltransferase family protein [Ktedonobacterales bacterium]
MREEIERLSEAVAHFTDLWESESRVNIAPVDSMRTRAVAEMAKTPQAMRASRTAETPRLLDRTAWRDAALFWLGQRLAVGALLFLGLRMFGSTASGWRLTDILASWDGDIYRNIASGGYSELWQAAFFPLYPLLEHVVALMTGGDTALAGVIIANAASLGAFGLLRVLVERELGRPIARRTLLYLVIFPVSFFLVAAYTESLFLLLSVAAFLALRRERWMVAGLCIALATLTRPVGVLLELALLAQYVEARRAGLACVLGKMTSGTFGSVVLGLWQEGRALLVPAVMPVAAVAGFCLYLSPRFHTLLAPSVAERVGWERYLSWPWDGLAQVGGSLLHDTLPDGLHAALDIGFTLLFLVLAVLTLRRLPWCYALVGCASVALVLLTPMHKVDFGELDSSVRYMLVVFPLFMLLARWGEEHRWVHRLVFSCSLLLLVLLIFKFASGAFVA